MYTSDAVDTTTGSAMQISVTDARNARCAMVALTAMFARALLFFDQPQCDKDRCKQQDARRQALDIPGDSGRQRADLCEQRAQ